MAREERRSRRPDRRLFERRDAAFRERDEPGAKLFIDFTPRRLVVPFEMLPVRTSDIARRIVPGDAEPPLDK